MTETLRKNSNGLKQKQNKRESMLSSSRKRILHVLPSDEENDGLYTSSSVNSSKNNKIIVTGYGFVEPQDLDTDKFIDEEIPHKSEINAVSLSGDNIQLPSYLGECYIGKGIQFLYNGQRYDMTEENEAKFSDIIANNDIQWRFNKEVWKKMGGTGNANFEVYLLDKSGKKIPDIKLSMTKSVNDD